MATLNTRLNYLGGDALGRIRNGKLRTLRLALKDDYNSRSILTEDGVACQCLINEYLLKSDYDRKIISVEHSSGLESGKTFKCLDDNTMWMVYLPDLAELAYLKSEIIRCRYVLPINGKDYWVYFQGPTETVIQWYSKGGMEFNEPNYSGTVYIRKDSDTEGYFHRFDKIKLANHTWEVHVVDEITVPGIIELEINEYFESAFDGLPDVIKTNENASIIGLDTVNAGDKVAYSIPRDAYSVDTKWNVSDEDVAKTIKLYNDGLICEIDTSGYGGDSLTVSYGDLTIDVTVVHTQSIVGPEIVYPGDENIRYECALGGTFSTGSKLVKITSSGDGWCELSIVTMRKGSFVISVDVDGTTYEREIGISSL